MSVSITSLYNELLDVYDSEPSTMEISALSVAKVICYDFLSDVQISFPPAPGLMPAAPSPIPDPTFAADKLASQNKMTPIVPTIAFSSILFAGLYTSMQASSKSPSSVWVAADLSWVVYMAAMGIGWKSKMGYQAAGITISAPVVFDAIFKGIGPVQTKEVQAMLAATYIFAVVRLSVFTGAYWKGAFIGPAPLISLLS